MKSRVNLNYMAIMSRAGHGYHISLAYHISRASSMKKEAGYVIGLFIYLCIFYVTLRWCRDWGDSQTPHHWVSRPHRRRRAAVDQAV